MKKIILTLTLAASAATVTIAQNNETDFREQFTFGLKGGANYSNVYDTEGEEFRADGKLGLAAGAFIAIPLGKYIGIQPEVLFSQKGFKATGKILGSTYSFTRTTNYIDVPLFFSFKPSEFISIHLGPQYSYLMLQSDVFKNASTTIAQETEFGNDNIRKNTLSFAAGADVNMKHLVLGVRAAYDVQNNNGNGASTTPRYKNMWYQFSVGYRFYGNKE